MCVACLLVASNAGQDDDERVRSQTLWGDNADLSFVLLLPGSCELILVEKACNNMCRRRNHIHNLACVSVGVAQTDVPTSCCRRRAHVQQSLIAMHACARRQGRRGAAKAGLHLGRHFRNGLCSGPRVVQRQAACSTSDREPLELSPEHAEMKLYLPHEIDAKVAAPCPVSHMGRSSLERVVAADLGAIARVGSARPRHPSSAGHRFLTTQAGMPSPVPLLGREARGWRSGRIIGRCESHSLIAQWLSPERRVAERIRIESERLRHHVCLC